MADTEFEEFRHYFERVPQHIRATAATYTLVHVDDDLSPSNPRKDTDIDFTDISDRRPPPLGAPAKPSNSTTTSSTEFDTYPPPLTSSPWTEHGGSPPTETRTGRRRRKLPDLPQGAKEAMAVATAAASAAATGLINGVMSQGATSLAAELGAAGGADLVLGPTRPLFLLRCSGFDDEASPDSSTSCADIDSGHSTLHSPQLHNGSLSLSPGSGSPPSSPLQLELLEATHRGLYKFVPRHHDELEVEIGDPIYVQKEADDLWCEGVNLRSGRSGSFPSAYAVDLEYSDFDPTVTRVRRERFLLRYLGSVETAHHKGTGVLAAAVRKVAQPGPDGCPKTLATATSCVLEVSDQGLRMVDRGRSKRLGPAMDYFYSLKHVSFCAFHPRDHRYIGFITKHPTLQRFACHVFFGRESTRPVAESIGRAFQKFYQKFIETAYPTEDIYIE